MTHTTMTMDRDPGLQVAAERLAEAQRALAAAQAARDALGLAEAGRVVAPTLKGLQADDALARAEEAVAQCARIHRAASTIAATRLRTGYREGQPARLRHALQGAQAALAALDEDLRLRDQVAAALGLAAGQGEHPRALAAQLVHHIAHALRALDPPAPAPVAPRPGYVTVRARVKFIDSDDRWHFPDAASAVDVLPERDVRAVIEEHGWAERVAVEGEA